MLPRPAKTTWITVCVFNNLTYLTWPNSRKRLNACFSINISNFLCCVQAASLKTAMVFVNFFKENVEKGQTRIGSAFRFGLFKSLVFWKIMKGKIYQITHTALSVHRTAHCSVDHVFQHVFLFQLFAVLPHGRNKIFFSMSCQILHIIFESPENYKFELERSNVFETMLELLSLRSVYFCRQSKALLINQSYKHSVRVASQHILWKKNRKEPSQNLDLRFLLLRDSIYTRTKDKHILRCWEEKRRIDPSFYQKTIQENSSPSTNLGSVSGQAYGPKTSLGSALRQLCLCWKHHLQNTIEKAHL